VDHPGQHLLDLLPAVLVFAADAAVEFLAVKDGLVLVGDFENSHVCLLAGFPLS